MTAHFRESESNSGLFMGLFGLISVFNLVKHSAIVSVIAVYDLTTAARTVISDTFMAFEIWLTTAAIYLILTITLSIGVAWLERRYQRR